MSGRLASVARHNSSQVGEGGGMFEWWAGLPWWLRVGVAMLFLLASTILWFAGRFWPWGWAVGVVLLLFSFPSGPEKRGYHDF